MDGAPECPVAMELAFASTRARMAAGQSSPLFVRLSAAANWLSQASPEQQLRPSPPVESPEAMALRPSPGRSPTRFHTGRSRPPLTGGCGRSTPSAAPYTSPARVHYFLNVKLSYSLGEANRLIAACNRRIERPGGARADSGAAHRRALARCRQRELVHQRDRRLRD